jgi:hypothetical protein
MLDRLALCLAVATFAAALFSVPAFAADSNAATCPTGTKCDTPYTFHVPLQITDINADTHRIPVVKVEVMCAVSENTTAHFPPVDVATGLPTGRSSDPSNSVQLAVPSNGTLNQTVDVVVKGAATERSYLCGMRFVLQGGTRAYPPADLNQAEGAAGPGSGTGAGMTAKKIPNEKPGPPDPGHPFDDATLKTIISGLIN